MFIVIMAGGSGTRFWPLSRAARPKQFLNIVGDSPMVVATYERVKELAPDANILLVVGEDHRAETERLFAGTDVKIIAEPMGRNTAPCIGLAAAYVESREPGAEMVVLPADHYVASPDSFRRDLLRAVENAAHETIVTLGIVPTRPETGYGYIQRNPALSPSENVYPVMKFVEKPDWETAVKYLAEGTYYWNAGVFVAKASVLMEEFARHMPAFHEGLLRLTPTFETAEFAVRLEELYAHTQSISFDYAIMENTERPVEVIPCECGWSDVGSWISLYEVRGVTEKDAGGNVTDGDAFLLHCRDSFVVSNQGRFVAAIGLKRTLLVDSGDAVLVADLDHCQDVKAVIEFLKERKRDPLL